jgi:hypothetical protein
MSISPEALHTNIHNSTYGWGDLQMGLGHQGYYTDIHMLLECITSYLHLYDLL